MSCVHRKWTGFWLFQNLNYCFPLHLENGLRDYHQSYETPKQTCDVLALASFWGTAFSRFLGLLHICFKRVSCRSDMVQILASCISRKFRSLIFLGGFFFSFEAPFCLPPALVRFCFCLLLANRDMDFITFMLICFPLLYVLQCFYWYTTGEQSSRP